MTHRIAAGVGYAMLIALALEVGRVWLWARPRGQP
jgi:hypothetical protein